jgi:hypothetical protein
LNRDRYYLRTPLRDHVANPDKFTYYGDFLDKVFWTLSSAPGEGGRFPGIPFLNGGLFDDDEFRQPANLRKTTPPLKVRNGTMQYVFDELLEAFNFTVTEDTPLNQEVAVDPEMLGKVFESIVLHAEQADPDATAPDKRKATGSYYTPRIVVHFICREVLYQYLASHLPGDGWGPRLKKLLAFDLSDGIDEEEKNELRVIIAPDKARLVLDVVEPLKCCDPAVGSGAFPVGLMHELVNLRRLLETVLNGYRDPVTGPQGSGWLHETKAKIVENCLYGVDIQQQAIEICRLRLWLSLVVDYDLGLDPFTAEYRQFSESINRISQLPNLEMNFRRGDSLHDHVSGIPVVILPDRASRHAAEFAAIAKLGSDLHQAKKAERKKKLRLDILEKRLELSRKIINEELQTIHQRDSALDRLFGDEESDADKRKRNQREIEHLEEALTKIEADQKDLQKLSHRDADPKFYPNLRKLEGADFDSPFNFSWSVDFPGVFVGGEDGGFDIIVGNPPFVTARNPDRRELWRQRWPRVCSGTYQLVCPFFELAFLLLKPAGQLGFIVSNAFSKREFGRPLVEDFFPTVDLQKIVDCSGLMFPGHGTPTCLVFGMQAKPNQDTPVRVVTILPGGGDLRTPPEESPLWRSIEDHHEAAASVNQRAPLFSADAAQGFRHVYEDFQVAVGDCSRSRILTHPCLWTFVEWPTFDHIEALTASRLRSFLSKDIGRVLSTSAIDIFIIPPHTARLFSIEKSFLTGITQGEEIRNWASLQPRLLLKPYDSDWQLVPLNGASGWGRWFRYFRTSLGNRKDFGGGTYDKVGRPWYEYHQLDLDKANARIRLGFSDLATHGHFQLFKDDRLFDNHSPIILLESGVPCDLVNAILNSSVGLFWLKQVCFNKGAGEDEHRDRFEYAGGKLQQLPISGPVAEALNGASSILSNRLLDLSRQCWEYGQKLPGFEFGRDFVLKTALTLVGQGARYEVEKFRKPGVREDIEAKWDEIASAIQDVLDFVRGKTFIQCDKAMPTYLVLIPLIFVRYKFLEAWKQAKDVDTYLLRCSLAGAFSGNPDNLLDALVKKLGEIAKFDLDETFEIVRSQGRSLELTEDRFWQMGYGSDTIHLLFNLWYRDFSHTPAYENNLPQVDHIFPQSALRKIKIENPKTGRKDLMKYREEQRNQLANCMLLTREENGAGGKRDILPADWFKDKDEAYLKKHLIPANSELWKLDRFEDFIAARQELIRSKFSPLLVNKV